MKKIDTYEKALEKINEILNHKDVEIAAFLGCKDNFWEYYFSLRGWFKGNYFQLYLTSHENIPEIDIPIGVTDQKTLFKKQFKL